MKGKKRRKEAIERGLPEAPRGCPAVPLTAGPRAAGLLCYYYGQEEPLITTPSAPFAVLRRVLSNHVFGFRAPSPTSTLFHFLNYVP